MHQLLLLFLNTCLLIRVLYYSNFIELYEYTNHYNKICVIKTSSIIVQSPCFTVFMLYDLLEPQQKGVKLRRNFMNMPEIPYIPDIAVWYDFIGNMRYAFHYGLLHWQTQFGSQFTFPGFKLERANMTFKSAAKEVKPVSTRYICMRRVAQDYPYSSNTWIWNLGLHFISISIPRT
jgi:hypothetical protein